MSENFIYTGFVKDVDPGKYANLNAEDFFSIWIANTQRFAPNTQIRILGPDVPNNIAKYDNVKSIAEYPNLGHVHDYLDGKRDGIWCGWTAGIVLGMVDAYVNGKDFIYKEQDCLAFGDFVSRMKKENDNYDITYGSCRLMGPAQSLFIVRNYIIPVVIGCLAQYKDKDMLPEYKFKNLQVRQNRLSFGYDRDRPFNMKDEVFYIQQLSDNDMNILINNNLI
jgi:hypothetical protein